MVFKRVSFLKKKKIENTSYERNLLEIEKIIVVYICLEFCFR